MVPPKRIISKQLGQLLLEKKLINQTQLNRALQIQKEKGGLLGEILLGLGFVKEEDIAQAITTQYGFPYLPLANYEIDPTIAKLIPENVARQYCVIPVDKIGDVLSVAIANPLNLGALEDIEYVTGSHIQVFVSTSSDIKKAIERYFKTNKQTEN